MKTDNLQVAERLSRITGRPLEDFYEGETEINVESGDMGEICSNPKTTENIEENEHRSSGESICFNETKNSENITKLAKEWKGEANIYGDKIIKNKRQMLRKEFMDLRKSFKTVDEFMEHPLLLVMFRSENQLNPAFPHWCDDVIKHIEANNKEKK